MYGLLEVFGDHLYITIFGVLLTTVYLYLKHVYSHFDRLGIEYIKPTLLFGNMSGAIMKRETMAMNFQKLYHKMNGRFGGTFTFTRPILLIKDPELINQILIKDFDCFTNRGLYINEQNDPLSGNLLTLIGDKWRNMRNRLSPTFSSGKLKFYCTSILDIAHRLQNYITDQCKQDRNIFEIKDLVARYTTDIITSVAFGADVDSINNPKEIFREIGEIISSPQMGLQLRLFFALSFPGVMKLFGIKLFPQRIEDFICSVTEQSLKLREKDKMVRHDFMQLLVLLRNGAKLTDDGKWEVKEIAEHEKLLSVQQMMAQVFIFFVAGFETSASAISLAVFEIAKQPSIQVKLQTEIDDVLRRRDGKLTYEAVQEMKYLAQCFDEILRMYPSVPFLLRIAERDYKLPGTDKIIPKGHRVMATIHGMHNDPKYFKNPGLFDPERFAPENKVKFHPHTYMPFSDGPRNCIGMRLGLLQARIGLAAIFQKFHVDLAPGQATNLKFNPGGNFTALGGIKVAMTPRY